VAKAKADQIRALSKKWLETGDDFILNELIHATHDGVHFKVGNRCILERYKEHGLELHAHFFGDGIGNINGDTCAVSQYRGTRRVADNLPICVDDSGPEICGVNSGQCQRSVFIDVRELVQDPEGMKLGVRLPGLVRLQTLDECFGLNGYATESIFSDMTFEPRPCESDGELIAVGWSFPVLLHELPDDMIESRS
jgi:hypothetical protein